MASLVGGAALGAVFGEVFNVLHDTVKSVGSNALMFKPILKSLKFNLDLIDPVVKEITRLNEILGHREEETKSLIEDMRKAKELIGMLDNQELDYPSQASFGRELAELDDSIVTFFQLHISVQNRRDILQILEKQNFLCKQMESLVIKIEAMRVVPPPPDFTVGMQPLNENWQQILLTALVDMWAELHKLDEVGNKAIDNLHKIATRNLANLVRKRKDAGKINKYDNEDYVTQHDLLRELAIFESCQGPERQRRRLIMPYVETLPSWCTVENM